MIELAEVAEFVDDDIVREVRRKKREFVVKIQISFARTAPPSRSLVPDSDSFPFEMVGLIEIC